MDDDFESLYKKLKQFLKKHKKKFRDINFITVYEEDEDENITVYEIDKNDFKKTAKTLDIVDTSNVISFVGDNWWITTDDDEFDSYFKFYQVPSKPKKKINLAKELLLNSEKEAVDILKLRFDEEE